MAGLKQFFSYFGSKVSHAKHYPAPIYPKIIEPFAGSAGYACRYPELEVILLDTSEPVVSVWKYLIRATRSDILSLPLRPEDAATLSQAEKNFIGFWWRRCGAVPSMKPVPWMLTGKHPYSFWSEQTRARIANQVDRIKHWECHLLPYNAAVKVNASWFIDPPYQAQGTRYPQGSGMLDYTHLKMWVHSLPGQVMVCESAGATWLPFRPLFENRTVKYKKSARTIQEMVWP